LSILMTERGCRFLLFDPYALPDVLGFEEPALILMRRERRGRSAGREPAMMPMPSSVKDQKPILPVAYRNSPGSLYSVRYLSRTIVAHEALKAD
jgi:hypothetical protein